MTLGPLPAVVALSVMGWMALGEALYHAVEWGRWATGDRRTRPAEGAGVVPQITVSLPVAGWTVMELSWRASQSRGMAAAYAAAAAVALVGSSLGAPLAWCDGGDPP